MPGVTAAVRASPGSRAARRRARRRMPGSPSRGRRRRARIRRGRGERTAEPRHRHERTLGIRSADMVPEFSRPHCPPAPRRSWAGLLESGMESVAEALARLRELATGAEISLLAGAVRGGRPRVRAGRRPGARRVPRPGGHRPGLHDRRDARPDPRDRRAGRRRALGHRPRVRHDRRAPRRRRSSRSPPTAATRTTARPASRRSRSAPASRTTSPAATSRSTRWRCGCPDCVLVDPTGGVEDLLAGRAAHARGARGVVRRRPAADDARRPVHGAAGLPARRRGRGGGDRGWRTRSRSCRASG